MQVLSLRWSAKYGHFLRAEANINALSYPIPPRTAILGLLAAILGFEKDTLPSRLDKTQIAIGGEIPQRFWHRVKLRKDPPTALPMTIKTGQKGSGGANEKVALILQEWLWQPNFLVHIAMPENQACFSELCNRVAEKRWHFSPCMGLSELFADIEFIGCAQAKSIHKGQIKISSIFPQTAGRVLNTEQPLGIHLLRMPHSVTTDRVFSHKSYYLEHQGRDLTVETNQAWALEQDGKKYQIVFL